MGEKLLLQLSYRKSVTREEFLQWVESAWESISEDTIKNSFSTIKKGLSEIEDYLFVEQLNMNIFLIELLIIKLLCFTLVLVIVMFM